MLFRRHARLAPASRAALTNLLAAPTFELIPLKNALDQAALLPPGATVSVTASPTKGLEATVALAAQLRADGFRVVPHLSARMVRDRSHLCDLVAALRDAGVDRAFVVGGDEKEPGAYVDGLALLRGLAGLDLVGADVVEVAPPYDGPGQVTSLLAANLMFEIVTLFALAWSIQTLAKGEKSQVQQDFEDDPSMFCSVE